MSSRLYGSLLLVSWLLICAGIYSAGQWYRQHLEQKRAEYYARARTVQAEIVDIREQKFFRNVKGVQAAEYSHSRFHLTVKYSLGNVVFAGKLLVDDLQGLQKGQNFPVVVDPEDPAKPEMVGRESRQSDSAGLEIFQLTLISCFVIGLIFAGLYRNRLPPKMPPLPNSLQLPRTNGLKLFAVWSVITAAAVAGALFAASKVEESQNDFLVRAKAVTARVLSIPSENRVRHVFNQQTNRRETVQATVYHLKLSYALNGVTNEGSKELKEAPGVGVGQDIEIIVNPDYPGRIDFPGEAKKNSSFARFAFLMMAGFFSAFFGLAFSLSHAFSHSKLREAVVDGSLLRPTWKKVG